MMDEVYTFVHDPIAPKDSEYWRIRESYIAYLRGVSSLRPDEPCLHPGCLSHVTHPCEGCGRIAGRYQATPQELEFVDSRPLL